MDLDVCKSIIETNAENIQCEVDLTYRRMGLQVVSIIETLCVEDEGKHIN
jgi:hypothetical protein